MLKFLILLFVALVFSSVGFKKYVWFISIGYGFSVAAIGLALLVMFHGSLSVGTVLATFLFIIYGCRLGGYLTYREFMKSGSYNKAMTKEIKDGSTMSMAAKIGIWVSAALLYVCETSPVFFRLLNGKGTNAWVTIGCLVSICGLILESTADWQKNQAKKVNPHRFVDTGVYRLVRCPNYLGEMTFWTGVFLGGIGAVSGAQWLIAVLGYAGIIYVMFGGARRLEIRQNRNYGSDPEYRAYVKKTPIMVPFVPLYSVAKYRWLVG
jgi:steroid 5-alpha reductase family enzyme